MVLLSPFPLLDSCKKGGAIAGTAFAAGVYQSPTRTENTRARQSCFGIGRSTARRGIDAVLDQYEVSPPEGWPTWCRGEIQRADFVLMICTEAYYRCIEGEEKPGEGHGVLWEARIIHQLLYDAGAVSDKFVPVLFSDASPEQIPTPIKSWTHYVVDTKDGYDGLYRRLTGQPRLLRPTLGPISSLPTCSQQWSEGTTMAASSSLDCFARIDHLSISNAVRMATAHTEPIKHLRIFASTTDVILPVIADHRLYIDTCEVAIQWFDRNATDAKTQTLYAQCENKIAFWKNLKDQNFIKRILIMRYPFIPLHFIMLFEDKLLISGLYWPSDSPTSAVDYSDPWLINNSTEPGRKLISKYAQQFDKLTRPLTKTEL